MSSSAIDMGAAYETAQAMRDPRDQGRENETSGPKRAPKRKKVSAFEKRAFRRFPAPVTIADLMPGPL
jgi:hypothetical protein